MPYSLSARVVCLATLALLLTSGFSGIANAFGPVTCTGCTGSLINTPTAYDWPMLLHDAAHSGNITSPGPYSNSVLATKVFKGAITTSAAAANATIYVVAGQTLYALNSSTLKPFWSKSLGQTSYSSPASAGGKVFVGESDGTILAVDSVSGTTDWRIQTGSVIRSSPVVQGGKLFVSLISGTLLAIDTTTGNIVWSFSAGAGIVSSPSANGKIVAVGSNDGVMHFVNEVTGAPYWSVPTGAAISSSASFSSNFAYFGSNDSKVYAVDTVAKSSDWSFTTNGQVVSTPISTDGRVYAASLGGTIYALAALTGAPVWKFSSGPVAASMALAEGTHKNLIPTYVPMLYAVSTAGTLFGINRGTGNSEWSLPLNGINGGAPIVAYTKVYVGVANGNFEEVGALRYATAAATFTVSGVYSSHFGATSTVRLAANAAWGKMGLNNTFVSVSGPGFSLVNATMTFVTGKSNYNFYYDLTLAGAKSGTYKVTVALEDANPKFGSNNPRCCGWVDFKTTFSVP